MGGTGGEGRSPVACYAKSNDFSDCSWLTSGSQEDIVLADSLDYPGGPWILTVVDPATCTEAVVAQLGIADEDMFESLM